MKHKMNLHTTWTPEQTTLKIEKKQKYILLDVGDVIKEGDEEYSNDILVDPYNVDVLKWHPVSVTSIGKTVQEDDSPIRRKNI